MRKNMVLFTRLTAILLCGFLVQLSYAKKPVQKGASSVAQDEIDQHISAAEAEVAKLTAKLEQLRHDSATAASDFQTKMSAYSGKNSPMESQLSLKNQELAALKSQRDKARQDSLSAAAKLSERIANSKKEATRLEALVMAVSNQLNTLTIKRQAIPAGDGGGESKTVTALQNNMARADSAVKAKQNDIASFSKKREQLRQDSLLQESEAAEIRKRGQTEARRLDSLLLVLTQSMTDVSGKQGKSRESAAAALAQEQARLTELNRQKTLVDGQIAKTKVELSGINGERDRLKASSGASQKKNEATRALLVEGLASAEEDFQDKTANKNALGMLLDKIRIDSAITKAKNNLDGAIEQRARGKHGAEKLVDQYEGDVTTLMGQLDDVVRKHPRVTQYELKISNLTTTELKRRQVDTMIVAATAELTSSAGKRNKAKQALEDFDRKNQGAANPLTQRTAHLDSISITKDRAVSALQARGDSLSVQISTAQRSIDGLDATFRTESAKADSGAAQARKQKTELMVQRAQLRADSTKNESAAAVAIMKIKAEQAKLFAQSSLLDREIAAMSANKDKYKQAIVDAQNRDKMSKAANQQERKRLDSLIDVKEQEVSALSLQSEKASQEAQNISKDNEGLQKTIAAIALINSQIAAKTQEIASVNQQLDGTKKEKANIEKAGTDKIRAIELDIQSAASGLEEKKSEIAALKKQKEDFERNAAKQREEQERAAKALAEEQERQAKLLHEKQERTARREIARLDSAVNVLSQRIASLEAKRDKARQDSMSAEVAKADAIVKSLTAMKKHDSLNIANMQQVAELVGKIEKAQQDSVAKSVPPAGSALSAVKSLDSLIQAKEKEIADVRQQREKARLEAGEERRKQASVLMAAHQNITSHRTQLLQKKAETMIVQNERKHLQQDSAVSVARAQAAVQLAAAEIAQNNALLDKKKAELAALQSQREATAKTAAPTPTAAPAPATALAPADAAQKQMEEIYMLIGSNKMEEAVNRFKEQSPNLVKYVAPEAFKVLKSTIDQLTESIKKSNAKKR